MSAQQYEPVLFHAEQAWLGGDDVEHDVLIECRDGVIWAVSPNVTAPANALKLPGLTLPGLVNTHSHVFHRAIRGQGQRGVASFWAWRDLMYSVSERLDPDTLYDLAFATYAEMALSGISTVGEFFYLHHDRNGRPYSNPNELGETVVRAANAAGLRITLLDTCYLQADINGAPLSPVQQRFGDGSWEAWASRVDQLQDQPLMRVGAAIHSVRAVPRDAIRHVSAYAKSRDLPLHVHLSEQPAENEACVEAFGITPTELLRSEGALGAATTAVHATHLTDQDIHVLGSSGTTISMCCTTERDLADGVGPASRLAKAGSPLVLGSDAHMVIDLLEEARAMELDERLLSGKRGHHSVPELAAALTSSGAASLGWNAGSITVGALADLVTVSLDSPRTAGARLGDPLAHVVFAGTGADVETLIVAGKVIVQGGRHLAVENTGRALEKAISKVLN